MSFHIKNVYHHPLITNTELEIIANTHKQICFKKGDFILRENQIAKDYYIVESGLFRSYLIDFNGNEITIDFFGSNQILIEVSSLFRGIPTKENIQALTDGLAWKMEYDEFQQLYHRIKGFNEWGRAWMSQQLFNLKERSVDMLTKSAMERYIHLIENKPEIIKYAPLKHIASYLGITDTSLSRIRKEVA